MQGIANDILANPHKYSVEMLKRGMESGSIPPYVVIPAIQEILRLRKQMQGAANPQAAQQPPIAQQVMQEADAIATLPTNLPEQYAGGGIVAFAGGGGVERFDAGGLTQEERDFARMRRVFQNVTAAGKDVVSLPYRGLAGAAESVVTRPLRAVGVPIPYLPTGFYGGDVSSMTPYMDRLRREREEASSPAPPPTTDTGATPQPRPAAPAAPRVGIPALPGAAAAAPTSPMPMLALPEGPSVEERTRELFGDLNQRMEQINEETDRRIRESRGLLTGKPFEEYRRQLEDEAKQSGAEREQAKSMAFVKAGLAIMAGTSQHALANIGQGAMVGVADWQAATKDLKKADRERRKEFALIEQAGRAEQRGDIEREERLLDSARNRGITALQATASALQNAYGLDRGQALEVAKTNFNLQGQDALLGRKIAADRAEGAADRANRVQVATIQAEANARGQRPLIPAAEAGRINREVRELEPQIRRDVLKSLGLKETGLSDASRAVVDRTVQERVQQMIDQRVQDTLRISAGIAGLASAPATGQPSAGMGMELVGRRSVPQ